MPPGYRNFIAPHEYLGGINEAGASIMEVSSKMELLNVLSIYTENEVIPCIVHKTDFVRK
jgi:hypothetical protein